MREVRAIKRKSCKKNNKIPRERFQKHPPNPNNNSDSKMAVMGINYKRRLVIDMFRMRGTIKKAERYKREID